MREIKFRVWYNDFMFYNIPSIMFHNNGALKKINLNYEKQDESLSPDTWTGDGDFEILMFTGLKDNKGRDIFKGDIVVKEGYKWYDNGIPNYRGTVEWIYSQWQVVAHLVNSEKVGISDGVNEGLNDEGFDEGEKTEWIVIGNIYENPKLLS